MAKELMYEVYLKMDATYIDKHSKLKPRTKIDINPLGELLVIKGSRNQILKRITEQLDDIIDKVDKLYYDGDEAEIMQVKQR